MKLTPHVPSPHVPSFTPHVPSLTPHVPSILQGGTLGISKMHIFKIKLTPHVRTGNANVSMPATSPQQCWHPSSPDSPPPLFPGSTTSTNSVRTMFQNPAPVTCSSCFSSCMSRNTSPYTRSTCHGRQHVAQSSISSKAHAKSAKVRPRPASKLFCFGELLFSAPAVRHKARQTH